MPLELLIASHEEAQAGIAELWLDGRLFGATRFDVDQRIKLEVREGPWLVDLGELHRAIERMEELVAMDRPGAA